MDKLRLLALFIAGYFAGFITCVIFYKAVFIKYSEALHSNYCKALDLMKTKYDNGDVTIE